MSDYPKIMRHNTKGVIVRFTEECVGTVVGGGNAGDSFNIGHRSTTWNMGAFKDYKPEIHKTK